MPPEAWDPALRKLVEMHGYEVDFWAVGVLLHKMAFNKFPFWQKPNFPKPVRNINDINTNLYYQIINHKLDSAHFGKRGYCDDPRFPISNLFLDLLKKLMHKDMDKRIGYNKLGALACQEVMEHPWFQAKPAIDFSALRARQWNVNPALVPEIPPNDLTRSLLDATLDYDSSEVITREQMLRNFGAYQEEDQDFQDFYFEGQTQQDIRLTEFKGKPCAHQLEKIHEQ